MFRNRVLVCEESLAFVSTTQFRWPEYPGDLIHDVDICFGDIWINEDEPDIWSLLIGFLSMVRRDFAVVLDFIILLPFIDFTFRVRWLVFFFQKVIIIGRIYYSSQWIE